MMRYTEWIVSDEKTAEHLKDCRTRAEQIAADFKAWQKRERARLEQANAAR